MIAVVLLALCAGAYAKYQMNARRTPSAPLEKGLEDLERLNDLTDNQGLLAAQVVARWSERGIAELIRVSKTETGAGREARARLEHIRRMLK